MSFFSVFDLDCRTDVTLVGRRGVREVEAVLAHALVHAASEAQPADRNTLHHMSTCRTAARRNTCAQDKKSRGITRMRVSYIRYATYGVYVCRLCCSLIISISINNVKITRGYTYCDHISTYIKEL